MYKNVKLPPGKYDYRISKPGFGTIYDTVEVTDKGVSINKIIPKNGHVLKIVPTPSDSIVKVEINGHLVEGSVFTLSPGIYNYQVSKIGLSTIQGMVAIVDRDVTKNVSLGGIKYRLALLCNYTDAIIEVEINGGYVKGNIHRLISGSYKYRVNKAGYPEVTGTAIIIDKDVVVPITFAEDCKTLTFNVTPLDATVEVQVNGNWVGGKVHNLPPGKYNYVISKAGYKDIVSTVEIVNTDVVVDKILDKGKFTLNIVTTPIDAIAKVEINGIFVEGKEFELDPGEYKYQVSKTGFDTVSGTVSIVNDNVNQNVSLDGSKYILSLVCEHIDALIEVEINGAYIIGSSHTVVPGSYKYRVSKPGYSNVTGVANVVDVNVDIPITLVITSKTLTFNVTPIDSTVEVQIGLDWVAGKTHTLAPGRYNYVISKVGYKDVVATVDIADIDVTVTVTLVKGINIPFSLVESPIFSSTNDLLLINSTGGLLAYTKDQVPESTNIDNGGNTNEYNTLTAFKNLGPFTCAVSTINEIYAIRKINSEVISIKKDGTDPIIYHTPGTKYKYLRAGNSHCAFVTSEGMVHIDSRLFLVAVINITEPIRDIAFGQSSEYAIIDANGVFKHYIIDSANVANMKLNFTDSSSNYVKVKAMANVYSTLDINNTLTEWKHNGNAAIVKTGTLTNVVSFSCGYDTLAIKSNGECYTTENGSFARAKYYEDSLNPAVIINHCPDFFTGTGLSQIVISYNGSLLDNTYAGIIIGNAKPDKFNYWNPLDIVPV